METSDPFMTRDEMRTKLYALNDRLGELRVAEYELELGLDRIYGVEERPPLPIVEKARAMIRQARLEGII